MFGRQMHDAGHHAGGGRACSSRRGPGTGHAGHGMRMGGGGMGGRFGEGGGRQRVFAPGDLQLVMLHLIEAQPRHGYDLIRAIAERFGGLYTPSPGAVYPTLTLLEEQGYVRAEADAAGGSRRLYAVTAEGSAHLASRKAEVDGALARMELAARAMAGSAVPDEIRQAMHTLKHALVFHRGDWSPAEVERVRHIIDQAAQAVIDGDPRT